MVPYLISIRFLGRSLNPFAILQCDFGFSSECDFVSTFACLQLRYGVDGLSICDILCNVLFNAPFDANNVEETLKLQPMT